MTKRRWTRGSFLIFIIGSLALVLLIYGVVQQSTQPREVDLSTLLADVKSDVANKQLDTLTVTSDSLILQRANGKTEQTGIDPNFSLNDALARDNGVSYADPKLLRVTYE